MMMYVFLIVSIFTTKGKSVGAWKIFNQAYMGHLYRFK